MITFNKGQVNDVVVTLRENSTVAAPIYLFLFVNQQTKAQYYFIAPDTSQFTERFNRFSVTEKNGANTLAGEVSLGNEGFYEYTAYQTSLADISGLVTAVDAAPFIVKEVELGLVWVVLPEQSYSTYEPETDVVAVYQNNGYILTETGDYLLSETGFLIEQE